MNKKISPILLVLFLSNIINSASCEDIPEILKWDNQWNDSSYHVYGPISIPSDGYLGYSVEYTGSYNDVSSGISVEINFPYEDNNCYTGNIPAEMSLTNDISIENNLTIQEKSTILPILIKRQANVTPGKIYADHTVAVPAGQIYVTVSTPSYYTNDLHKLTVFWEKAYPSSPDHEINRVFDRPLDLGRLSIPAEIPSHIGFINSQDYVFNNQYACIIDNDDYFKFSVEYSDWYYLTFESVNDNWYLQLPGSTYFCKPTAQLQEQDSLGKRYLENKWSLLEKGSIGPYFFSVNKSYYLNLQRDFLSPLGANFECTASVNFKIVRGEPNYTIIKFNTYNHEYGKYGIAGNKLFFDFQLANVGPVAGTPYVKLNVLDQSDAIRFSSSKTVTVETGIWNARNVSFIWDIPKPYITPGKHKVIIDIIENNRVVLRNTEEILILENTPPIAGIINLLLLSPYLDSYPYP